MLEQATTCLFYIDDDTDDLEFFKAACDELGKSVKLFHFPDDFFRDLRNPPPAPTLIFLDLNMPLRSGFEIIEELKISKTFCDVPLIVYSTAADVETVKRCRKFGASMYVVKPTSLRSLKNVIQAVLKIDWQQREVSDANFLYKFDSP